MYITMHKQKASIYKLSCNKAPKHSKFRPTDKTKDPVEFFYGTSRVSTLAPRNDFANSGSFAKVFAPVEIIIPCSDDVGCAELWSCITKLHNSGV